MSTGRRGRATGTPLGARGAVRDVRRAAARRGPRGVNPPADRGAVTAELAVGMVAVAAVLVAVLAVGAATVVRLTCLDAARTAARVAALGESDGEVVAAARHVLGPRGGDVRVRRDGGWVTVAVSAPFTAWDDGLRAAASATAWAEP